MIPVSSCLRDGQAVSNSYEVYPMVSEVRRPFFGEAAIELEFEDALDIFRGWRDDTSPVAFFLDGSEALVKIRGVVTQVLTDEIMPSTLKSMAEMIVARLP